LDFMNYSFRQRVLPLRHPGALLALLFCLPCISAPLLAADPILRLETLIIGLSSPVFVTHAGDGSGRLFIVEQEGRIRIFKSGQLLPTPFLDISPQVDFEGEKGFLGLALHPNFAGNGRFFVNYVRSIGGPLRTVIAEFRVSRNNPDIADPAESVLLEFNQPFSNHNGGMIAFGPDGYLYIGTGDGGSGGDPLNNGQRTDTLLGKILRIDVDGAAPYAVPPDNPFVGRTGTREEIWAYGLRNPWRFSFDRLTGRLFAGDVGQDTVEEIDIIVRNGNYGWRIMEGNNCFSPPAGCNRAGLIRPIADLNREEANSVTGGYVYRGAQVTSLKGAYIFADFVTGRIWSLVEMAAETWKRTELLRSGLFVSSFGEDEQGELYLVDYLGTVRRLLFGSDLVFPQVPDGGGYTTDFTLTNIGGFTARGTLRFFSSDGTPRQVTLAGVGTGSSFPVQVPAGGTRALQTSGEGPAATGMALLEVVPSVGAVATFRFSSGGKLSALAGVSNAVLSGRVTVPVRTVGSSDTGVAVANPGDAPVNVRLVLVNRDGAEVQAIDLPQLNPLPPKSQASLFVTKMGFQNAGGLSDSSLRILVQGLGEVGVTALTVEDGLISVLPVIAGTK
jgi:glucose/arabinose dehydrogenase